MKKEKENETQIKVFVPTSCGDFELLYGTTLIFKTLRVGFPTASETTIDNNSIPKARAVISGLTRKKIEIWRRDYMSSGPIRDWIT